MKNLSIKLPENSSELGKADEIAIIAKLADTFDHNTYIGGLLTPDLVNWFNEMVKNDFSPDVYANYRETEERADRLASQKNEIAKYLENEKLTSENLKVSRDNAVERGQTEYNRAENAEARVWSLEREIADNQRAADEKIAALEARIAALKVEVYDLTHAG